MAYPCHPHLQHPKIRMKKTVYFLFLLLSIASFCNAQEVAQVSSKRIDSQYFPFEREILIYTPDNYNEYTETEYDVIYVFDSQYRSRFDLVQSLMHYGCQSDAEDKLQFIVVGIVSPNIPELSRHRNNDFLPVPRHITMSSPYFGDYDKFKDFVKEEVIPYMDKHYRTSGHTLAIGHSLGASFILNALATDNLFDDYIAMSPNLEWDKNRFAESFINYDFANSKPRYIFMSMANESEETGWGKEWRPAWDSVKAFVERTDTLRHINFRIKEYPQYSHNKCYHHVLMDCLGDYSMYRQNTTFNDLTLYPVHIELVAPDANGEVFITGNQKNLADWNPAGVKMREINDSTYAVDLRLMFPAEFKFTQGSWDKQISPANAALRNLRISRPNKRNWRYIAR